MDDESFRHRTLEHVCARRASFTVLFYLSSAIFLTSAFLLFAIDLSRVSTIIAVFDSAITGFLAVASWYVLRTCDRRAAGE